MLKIPVSITALGSVSPLGERFQEIWENYQLPHHYITERDFGSFKALAASLPEERQEKIMELRNGQTKYKNLDASALYAMYAARKATAMANWKEGDSFGINIGSSRGATSLFERYHRDFLERGKTGALASPTTTLGNISSWVGHDLQHEGPEISHSITCSTSLHALLNGVAWLQGGLAERFLVGGSEAALTAFTIAQMRGLKVYATPGRGYPCRALDVNKKGNTMVLGEGAAMACLEAGYSARALAKIEGIGYATEALTHPASMSAEGDCLQKAMRMALGNLAPNEVEVIVMHAPGTVKGDLAELRAVQKVFGGAVPALTTNKWKIGHTFGASGMLSIELGVLMLQHQQFVPVPFVSGGDFPKKIARVLVNAVGFGGNAVSVLLSK